MNKYRIVFMGTPDFGVPALEAMDAHGYKPIAIYCQPDKINGREGKSTIPRSNPSPFPMTFPSSSRRASKA